MTDIMQAAAAVHDSCMDEEAYADALDRLDDLAYAFADRLIDEGEVGPYRAARAERDATCDDPTEGLVAEFIEENIRAIMKGMQ